MKVFILVLFFTACASAKERPWIEQHIALDKMKWRICNVARDGIEKAYTGFCWISKECRKKFLAKEECRPKPLYCKYEDRICIESYEIHKKVFVTP